MKNIFSFDTPTEKTTATIKPETPIKVNELETLWNLVKQKIKSQIHQEDFETWVRPATLAGAGNNKIQLQVPNMLFYQEFTDTYLPKIYIEKDALGYHTVEVQVEVDSDSSKDQKDPLKANPDSPFQELPQSTSVENQTKKQRQKEQLPIKPTKSPTPGSFSQALSKSPSQLDPAYTFDSFVKGPSNQFAAASCHNVAENPGQTYNPLFVYGHTGLGKTHLMQAVGNTVLKINPNQVVTYVRAESFMNEMIYCIRHSKTWEFRQKYRNCDVLLVDDIQFISGKSATQEEFFHTFNALYEAKKQIVITSDLFPQDIPQIEERLRNRFQWGLITDIQPPDVEHRMAILINKAEKLGIHLSEDVAEYIATHAKRNIRELEGALHRIHAFATLHGRPIDLSLATETFQHVLGEPPKRLTIETIQKTVAEHFKLKVSDLKSKKRQRALTLPRQIAMYLSRNMTKSSFPEIGASFGGKDHTTIMHAVKKIEKERAKDLDLKAHVESLERSLEQSY